MRDDVCMIAVAKIVMNVSCYWSTIMAFVKNLASILEDQLGAGVQGQLKAVKKSDFEVSH